nr:hypothetical protein CFP56_64642 [Quercus suber]
MAAENKVRSRRLSESEVDVRKHNYHQAIHTSPSVLQCRVLFSGNKSKQFQNPGKYFRRDPIHEARQKACASSRCSSSICDNKEQNARTCRYENFHSKIREYESITRLLPRNVDTCNMRPTRRTSTLKMYVKQLRRQRCRILVYIAMCSGAGEFFDPRDSPLVVESDSTSMTWPCRQ